MGPGRERGEQRPVGPSGVWRWILHREKAGPDWGLLSSSSKALPPTTVALLLSNPLPKKKISAGNPGTETKDQKGMGDGYRNDLSRRVWPQLPGSQSPQFFHGPPSGPWNPEGPAGNMGSGELGL